MMMRESANLSVFPSVNSPVIHTSGCASPRCGFGRCPNLSRGSPCPPVRDPEARHVPLCGGERVVCVLKLGSLQRIYCRSSAPDRDRDRAAVRHTVETVKKSWVDASSGSFLPRAKMMVRDKPCQSRLLTSYNFNHSSRKGLSDPLLP